MHTKPNIQNLQNKTGSKISQKTQKHFHPNNKNLDKLINFKVISLTLHTIVGYDVADANQACARYNKDLIGSLTSSEAKGWKRLAFSCNSSIHALRTSFLHGHQHGDADNSRKHQIRFYPTQFKPIPNSHSWLSSLPTDRCSRRGEKTKSNASTCERRLFIRRKGGAAILNSTASSSNDSKETYRWRMLI